MVSINSDLDSSQEREQHIRSKPDNFCAHQGRNRDLAKLVKRPSLGGPEHEVFLNMSIDSELSGSIRRSSKSRGPLAMDSLPLPAKTLSQAGRESLVTIKSGRPVVKQPKRSASSFKKSPGNEVATLTKNDQKRLSQIIEKTLNFDQSRSGVTEETNS